MQKGIRYQIRKCIFHKPVALQQNLAGRKFLVTGAAKNSIGYATAIELLNWGAEVTITRRSGSNDLIKIIQSEIKPEHKDNVYAHDLDISDAKSVKEFSSWYQQEREALDVLINCAGIHLDLLSKWKEPKLSSDGFEIQWRTNYLGTTHLTHLLLPLLIDGAKNSKDSRIINVVSMLHSRGRNTEFFNPTKPYNSWNAYGQSKLGLVHFTFELQRRYSEIGVQAYCLHPGEVFTNVAGKGLSGNPVIESIRNFFAPVEGLMLMTPYEGAQTQLLCATSKEALGGYYYRDCKIARASVESGDLVIAEQLWKQNIDWVNTL